MKTKQIVLLLIPLNLILAYFVYNSIDSEIKFQKVAKVRIAENIQKLNMFVKQLNRFAQKTIFLEPEGSKWVKMDPNELEPGSESAGTGQMRLDFWI